MAHESRTTIEFGIEPRYSLPEAAKLADCHSQTLRTWLLGWPRGDQRRAQPPVILLDGSRPARGERLYVSFFNVVEARFLAQYRRHGVSMQRVRDALRYASERLGKDRPLLNRGFQTDGRDLFVEFERDSGLPTLVTSRGPRVGALLNVSAGGQFVWPDAVRGYFKDLMYDEEGPIQLQLYRRGRGGIANPRMGFGHACVAGLGVRTETIFDRFTEGESMKEIAEDFDLEPEDVEAAIQWETSAQLAA